MGKFYETFDSGAGPVIPETAKGDFDHNDSDESLTDSDQHGKVPETPSQAK
jgi:hypothetical protein